MSLTLSTTIQEVVTAAVNARLADCYHKLPGIVEKYYPLTHEADVRIGLTDPRFDPETDERADEEWPIYPKVRVAWPRFGGFQIVGPIATGDKVEVFFQDLDDSAFRVNGQTAAPVLTRRFDATGAFCVPWDITTKGVSADAADAENAMILGKEGGVTQIRINGTTIDLGDAATEYLAMADKVLARLNAIVTGFNSHTHAVAVGSVPFSGPSGPPTPTLTTPASVASSVARSQ